MIRRSTWLLLIAFIVLAVGVFAWQRWEENRQSESTATLSQSYLFDLGQQAIVRLAITSSQGKAIEAAKDDKGNWILVQPPGQPADAERIDAAAGAASALRVLADVNPAPDFETIGLNPASYQVEITRADGVVLAASVGDLTPTQSGYYVFLEGEPIQVVDRFGLEAVLELLNNPPVLQPTPEASSTLTAPVQP